MQDKVMPEGKWEFNEDVAGVFDDMLARSIPQYELMRESCNALAASYITPNTNVIDIGCSCGEAIRGIVDAFNKENTFIGLEASPAMIAEAKKRYKNVPSVDIIQHDLRTDSIPKGASVVMSILTLMFTPIEYRHGILKKCYDSLLNGGAFILVEKVLGETPEIHDAITEQYYNMKRRNGYSDEQIDRKKLSLEGVQVSVTASMNVRFMEAAGFSNIDCFWRWMNFAGWVAIKGRCDSDLGAPSKDNV